MKKFQNIFEITNSQKVIFCFSIIVTGRCNANCSYCRLYAQKNRNKIRYDISNELFETYSLFISEAKKILPPNFEIQCRFSGGEPLILGSRIFNLAEKIYTDTGIKPYILTNGTGINDNFVKLAKKSYINHLYVSIENPLDPAEGAPSPVEIIKKIKKYNSNSFPILPGVAVIANKHFKNLYKICRIFYKELRCLPIISEISFDYFIPPTKKQLNDLYKNVFKVVKHFHTKVAVKLFPDISPELCLGEYKYYIFPLDLENTYKITKNNIKEKLNILPKHMKEVYRDITQYCKNKNCEWFEDCKQIRWTWLETYGRITLLKKIKSYCKMKRTINQAFLEGLKCF